MSDDDATALLMLMRTNFQELLVSKGTSKPRLGTQRGSLVAVVVVKKDELRRS